MDNQNTPGFNPAENGAPQAAPGQQTFNAPQPPFDNTQPQQPPQGTYAQPQGTYAQPQGTYAQPQGTYAQPQDPYAQQSPYVQQLPNNGFVCGLISLILTLCCGGFGIVSPILAIVSLVQRKNYLKAGGVADSKTQTGMVLSIISLIVMALSVVVTIIMAVAGVLGGLASEDFLREFADLYAAVRF